MFLPTFVLKSNMPTVSAEGEMLAIDFGGTSLKLGLYKIEKGKVENMKKVEHVIIPRGDDEESKRRNGCVYNWIAEEVEKYLGSNKNKIRAGLTFSYPI